ncbi:MAG: two-component regulator propeller domain-containing protein [Bacteroidota bacterium]
MRPIIKIKTGNIWFGTEGAGVGKYDAEKFPGMLRQFTYYTAEKGLMHNGQRSLLEDTQGNMWMGTIGGGLNNMMVLVFQLSFKQGCFR